MEETVGMSCEDVRDMLYLFMLNEAGEDSGPIALHLLKCAACRKALAEHEALAGRMSTIMPQLTQDGSQA